MTDRPMIFSAPMICALKDGRKTQHRVVLDNVPPSPGDTIHARYAGGGNLRAAPYLDSYCSGARTGENPRGMSDEWCWWTRDDRKGASFKVRFVPGDRLWVREKWSVSATRVWTIADARRRIASDQRIIYAADGNPEGPWWASTQMPREFSRFTLTVTEVRVQRVQDISEADARDEGMPEPYLGDADPPWEEQAIVVSRVKQYRNLWDSLHGGVDWALNPWVCALTFTVEQRNIDEVQS